MATETWAATAKFVKWGLVFLRIAIMVGRNRESRYCDNARVDGVGPVGAVRVRDQLDQSS